MKMNDQTIVTLDNFEGPLDFLLHLIQKDEIDVIDISIKRITDQFLTKLKEFSENNIDNGAEFISAAASLLFIKSKSLLPKDKQEATLPENAEADPKFDVIHQLIEYCRFKDLARTLVDREESQGAFFERGTDEVPELKKKLGIDHLSLGDLASLFQQAISKAKISKGNIHEDIWRVSDKVAFIRQLRNEVKKIPFEALFAESSCREELVVTFLAILEMMKLGEILVIKDRADNGIYLVARE